MTTPIRTEDQIERAVEARMDRLDWQYQNTRMPAKVYEREVKAIDAWAVAEYARILTAS